MHKMSEDHSCGEGKNEVSRHRNFFIVGIVLASSWTVAMLGYLALGLSADLPSASHHAVTHLLGTAIPVTESESRLLLWNTFVLAMGFAVRIYAYATVALLAVKPYIDRRVRDVATHQFLRGIANESSAGVESLRGRSVLN
jgi:hypothetical protein